MNCKLKSKSTSGHIIVLTLAASLVLGVVLAGVISLSSSESQLTGRSESWNAAMPVVEAGIEEALTQLRYAPTNRTRNGWTLVDDQYTKKRFLGDGYYEVSISTNMDPIIISRGVVKAPGQTNYSIYRAVQVYATNDPLFSSAMEALETIDISGHPRIDSYDSRDPKYSTTNGGYKIGAFKDKGDIVAYAGVLNSVSLGNSDIYGHVITGPEGTLNLAKGTVGSVAWHDAGNTGVQPGWYKQTALPDYPPVEAPAPGGPATGGTIDKVSYQYIVGNGNYSVDAISGSVLVTGQATLTVNKSFSLSGNSSLTINKGASLKLYVNAPSVSVTGNGIVNQNTDAGTFMYFGLPGNTDIKLAGNGGFCGVIYAPNAALTLSGGGNSPLDFMGATITRKVTVNGHYNFHYDEATQRLLMRGYVVKSWDEL